MIYFVIYLFLEVMISSYISSMLGGLATFAMIVLSAVIGISMLRTFQYSLAQNIKDLTQGNISQEEFTKTNMAKALGAVLLIIPGFFTDILGILLQFGILTMIFSKIFKIKPQAQGHYNYPNTNTYTSANNFGYETKKQNSIDSEIIDVEVIETNDKNNK